LWSGCIKPAEDIKVGDIVIGDDGLPRTVVNTVTGTSPLYKVKQSYGDDYGISCEHILTLKFCGHCDIQWRKNQSKEGGWVMSWYDRETKTCKTKKIGVLKNRTKEQAYDIMSKLRDTINQDPIIDIHVNDYLSLPSTKRRLMLGVKLGVPIKWEHKKTKLDPRILGMWLGDGGKNTNVFTNKDPELINYCRNWVEQQGGTLTTYKDRLHHGISGCNFIQILKDCGIYNNKHIPKEYLMNSEQVRLEVLAGLIDTNGSVEQDGRTIRISQSTDHKSIITDTNFLAKSLGFRTTLGHKKTTWKYDGVMKTGTAIVLTISGYGIKRIPTLLYRKKCSTPKNTDMTCYSIEIVENGIGRFCGFEVDQNNRFLLGDFTVTHNCDQTGRTVIGPDPTLKMGELGFPVKMTETLTIPVRATNFNLKLLQTMIDEGKVKTLTKPDEVTVIDLERYRRGTRLMNDDIIHRGKEKIKVVDGRELVKEGDKIERNGKILDNLKPANRKYKLSLGWIVDRPVQNGDYVLLNRQPTLHKASMLGMKVVVKNYKTLRMNLAVTKPFNADFDGDEMNVHVPQSLESQTELKYLSAAQWNMISPQSSKPNMAIVQDSLVGAYIMTKGVKKLTKSQFFDISMKFPRAPWSTHNSKSIDGMMTTYEIIDTIEHVKNIFKEKNKKIPCYSCYALISLFLPNDFIYEKTNDTNPEEPTVKIWRGVLYEGTLDKSIIGASHNSIHQLLYKEYSPEAATHFIDCIQFTTNAYLLIEGFTVGLGDCLISQTTNKEGVTKEDEIRDVIQKCYIEAEGIKQTTTHPIIKEIRINGALSKAKDIGLRIAKDALDKDNNFLSTVLSGSKGDFFNIAQITGLLGQQNLKGQRIPLMLNHGKRSLPHYPFDELDPEIEYESRGFIDRGFLRGLNPRQFFFHAMTGREGISDTAMGTATSGYMQRRIIKLTEDMKIQEDGSVRDIPGKIYQIYYGQNGVDPSTTISVDGEQEICNISRMVAKLNMKHEVKNKL